jgi:hypothetical protein
MRMLVVQPRGTWRRGFDVRDGSGAVLGAFEGSPWREGGRIRAGGQEWEFRRERSRRFVLAGPQGEWAAADRVSFWSGRWQVSTGGRTYELVKAAWYSQRFRLRAGGVVVGELSPRGVFGNKADVTLPPELPPAVQVFVIAVAMTLWRREQSAAAGGAAAAAAGSS